MRISAITPIIWKTWTPGPGKFPCWACHRTNATRFVDAEITAKYETATIKLPVCEKCATYAAYNPDWLDEMLFTRRMEAISTYFKAEDGVLRGAE